MLVEEPEDHTGVWYCTICQQSTKLCVALKGQTTVETLTCSAIVVLRTTAEMVECLRYKLRVLGVPTDGPCDVFCDNDWVVPSTSRPEDPSLKNKHCSCAYHKQEIELLLVLIWIAYEDGKTNIALIVPTLFLVLYCNSWLVVECEEIKLSLPIRSRVKYPCWSRVKRTRPGCGWASIGCLCFLWLLISCDPMGLPAYGDIVNIVIFRAYCSRDNGAYFVSSRGAKIMLWGLTS